MITRNRLEKELNAHTANIFTSIEFDLAASLIKYDHSLAKTFSF